MQCLDARRASFSSRLLARFSCDRLISSGSRVATSAETPADPQYAFSVEGGQQLLSPQPPRPLNSLSPLLHPAGLRIPRAGAGRRAQSSPRRPALLRLARGKVCGSFFLHLQQNEGPAGFGGFPFIFFEVLLSCRVARGECCRLSH